jgi:hypothetical protein
MFPEDLKQNVTVYGPLFPEPVQIILAIPMGSSVKLIGKGVRSSTVYEPILTVEPLGQLHASPAQEPFDGDATKFRLGVEAMRLGLAYEYDPFFSLSIARVDRDTPGTRIYAEREFRESCQVLVATEAAGEGINLQFCWRMINYDIPWNPVRLEQRMGRIHRYGQEFDCLIFNFVTTNTREGRVLEKLFERIKKIEDDLDPQRTGKVFNVLGEVFAAN